MSSPASAPSPPPHRLDPLAAVLSYLLPGLGQVLQGRIGKGVLFFVCLYGLFFYGMWMGQMKNVWLPDAARLPEVEVPVLGKLDGVPKALYYRPQFLGQFWIGVAAWPALVQYAATEPPGEGEERPKATSVLGHYMQTPPEAGYGFDDYGIGHSLTLAYLRAHDLLPAGVWFPRSPSLEETGARRGCVVLAQAADLIQRIETVTTLRRWLDGDGGPAADVPRSCGV